MTTRRVRNPNVIHFTIDGRHGILGARHIAEALHIPYEPEGASTWDAPCRCGAALQHISTSAYGAEERAILEALFRISEGFYFGPHHLIMTSLLHFEEKVHRKKLREQMPFHYFFPAALSDIRAFGLSF
ncbi:hypothetical protein CK203_099431 [Vitis vinifera]|uniref:Uncharacterized protein n=1 Tax=Vitis vinifera TaxID=29760 RepID=A0A438BN96_VITVI|nr:hypothetical protein CK203_099431 [Vitis vinifera]